MQNLRKTKLPSSLPVSWLAGFLAVALLLAHFGSAKEDKSYNVCNKRCYRCVKCLGIEAVNQEEHAKRCEYNGACYVYCTSATTFHFFTKINCAGRYIKVFSGIFVFHE